MWRSAAVSLCLVAALGCRPRPKASVDHGLTAMPEENFTNSIGMLMVKTSDGYWVGAYEVTEGDYAKVMGLDKVPSISSGLVGVPASVPTIDSRMPIRGISSEQALEFCSKLTKMEKTNGTLPNSYVYSLPTERQWRAFVADARLEDAVMPTREQPHWSTPEGRRELKRMQQLGYRVVTQEMFHVPCEVGSRGPNRLGLYDVRGNVAEWCRDWYDAKRKSRAVRGGSFNNMTSEYWRIDNRSGLGGPAIPSPASLHVGFRAVLMMEKSGVADE